MNDKEANIRWFRSALHFLGKMHSRLMPQALHYCLNPEDYSNDLFAAQVASYCSSNALVLDIGAGTSPYANLFNHCYYLPLDIEVYSNIQKQFVTKLVATAQEIPIVDCSVDYILLFQVLEHVANPQVVLEELLRVLKPGGSLYLTVPQGMGLHHQPNHYFNFTRYGLAMLLEQAGYWDIEIQERGGIFWLVSKRMSTIPSYILFQYFYPLVRPQRAVQIGLDSPSFHYVIILPLIILLFVLGYPFLVILFPLAFFYLDRLDRLRFFTLGYQCVARKPKQ